MVSVYPHQVLSVFLLLYSGCQAEPESYILTVGQNQTIQSQGFPLTCCTEASYLITCEGGTTQCYIRMEFSDLDLPVGSTLTLYDGRSTNADLHTYQPKLISDGVSRLQWLRKTISSSGDALLLALSPPDRQGFGHVGFKIKVWATYEAPYDWDYLATSDNCPPVRYTMDGGQVHLGKSAPKSSLYSLTQFDCVWQIKMPVEFEGLDDYFVYVRFNNLTFDAKKKGHLFVVNEGISSEGTSLLQGNVMSLSDLREPDNMFTSNTGLYMRVRMYESSEVSVMKFVYGFAKTDTSSGESCSLLSLVGFKCQSSDVCVPISNKCDRVANCLDASDERREECKTLITTTTTTTRPTTTTTTRKPTTTPKSCYGYFSKRCPDGRCVPENTDCSTGCIKSHEKHCIVTDTCIYTWETCPGECGYNKKKCNDGQCVYTSDRCPEDGCESWEFTCDSGDQCVSSSYKCDGGDDCWDGSDESGSCSVPNSWDKGGVWDKGGLWWILAVIVAPIICIIACLVCCLRRKAHNTASSRSTTTNTAAFGAAANSPAAVAGAPPPTSTVYRPNVAYTQVNQGGSPTANITNAPETNSEPSAPPPPAYSDVITEPHQYPAPESGLPPPPSYETVSHIKNTDPSAPPPEMV